MQHRLDGGAPDPPGLCAEARPQHPQRQEPRGIAEERGVRPGRLYSLPWQSGFAGIGYNLKATGGKKIETIEQLLTDLALKGKVTLLLEMDTVGLVLLEQGKDPADFTDADFDAAIAMIQKAKDGRAVKGFTGNDYTDGLSKGDIAACVAWTGDAVQLQFANPDVGYALPEKGFTLWSDNFVIPALTSTRRTRRRSSTTTTTRPQMAQRPGQLHPAGQGHQGSPDQDDPETASKPAHLPPARC